MFQMHCLVQHCPALPSSCGQTEPGQGFSCCAVTKTLGGVGSGERILLTLSQKVPPRPALVTLLAPHTTCCTVLSPEQRQEVAAGGGGGSPETPAAVAAKVMGGVVAWQVLLGTTT